MIFIKRILLFLSLFLLFFIFKELLEFYTLMRSVHPIAGYLTLTLIGVVIYYFIGIPIYSILKLPKAIAPAANRTDEPDVIKNRLELFRENDYLKSINYHFPIDQADERTYDEMVKLLQGRCKEIRSRYITRLFYSSAISQNGFIDVILILSSSVNLIKEIFTLYNGRASNRDLITIGKKVYLSMAVGGSEITEYATEEIVTVLTAKVVTVMPFINKLTSSIMDGFVNAAQLTRISYITENYCIMTYIESNKDLSPSPKFIRETAKEIIADIRSKVPDRPVKRGLKKTVRILTTRKTV